VNKGTPEQSRQIRHHRRVAVGSFIAGGLFWIIGSVLVEARFGQQTAMSFSIFFWLFGGCGGLIFVVTYWVCPVCKHFFPRGSNGRHCANCDTSFDA
jgi:hypothetical protein